MSEAIPGIFGILEQEKMRAVNNLIDELFQYDERVMAYRIRQDYSAYVSKEALRVVVNRAMRGK